MKYTQHINELDFTGIPLPVRIGDIPKFEKKDGISINVFGYEKGESYPLHLTWKRELNLVDLLILNTGDTSHNMLDEKL